MNRPPIVPIVVTAALCFLAAVYGAVSVHFNWWPGTVVNDAKLAAAALLSVQDEELRKNWPTSMEFLETSENQSLTTIFHQPEKIVGEGLIFVDGGSQQLRQHCPENGCAAWLMDRRGRIRHVWNIGPRLVWEDAAHIEGFSRAENIYSVGAHPFPNGDLLVVYQGRNTYPYGVGLAMFDKDSNMLWRKDNMT